MRYEVRVYNLEELLPENKMTYTPCNGREDAKQKYATALEQYNDSLHIVDLCAVNYLRYGEAVNVLASSENANPRLIIWEQEEL